jgi:hypothetical protein
MVGPWKLLRMVDVFSRRLPIQGRPIARTADPQAR